MPLDLRFATVPIPFRFKFSHAAASRTVAGNVIVLVRDGAGHIGLGEGCPRAYVTGETTEQAKAFLAKHVTDLAKLENLADLRGWIAGHEAGIDECPGAFCAAELALLDLFARRSGTTLEALLGLPPVTDQKVSAVYSASGDGSFSFQRLLFGIHRTNDAKLKITGNAARDLVRVKSLARSGRVRVDANNLWPNPTGAIAALAPLTPHIWGVEEPCAARDWTALSAIQAATGLAIIADESVTRLSDLALIPAGLKVAVNLRISKMGGLLRSLAIQKAARAQGHAIIIGAQVGETSILARAALTLASDAGALHGFEAGYGAWLLRYDVTTPAIKAKRGFVASASFRDRSGAGLQPTDRLSRSF